MARDRLKSFAFLAIVCLGVIFIVYSCSDDPSLTPKPECMVEPTGLDFGSIFPNEHRDSSFIITNTGDGTLDVDITESSQYFSITQGGGPSKIASGDTLTAVVRFDPGSSIGTFSCTVETGTVCENVQCAGVCEASPSCRVSPLSLDFGPVKIDSLVDKTFTIKNTGEADLVGAVSLSCDDYEIQSGGGSYNLSPGDSMAVTVRFEPTSAGTLKCTVETGHETCSDVACVGVGIGSICEVFPDTLDFGTVCLGAHRDTTFTIMNTGGSTLSGTVTEFCDNYEVLTNPANYSLGSGETFQVLVRFEPSSTETKSCLIETGSGLCSDVWCTGLCEEPANCEIFPDTLDFGGILVGSSKDTTFTITNAGEGSLAIDVAEGCGEYSLVSGGGTGDIGAGESRDVTVRFAPQSAGTKPCWIATGTDCDSVFCTGFGTLPIPSCDVDPDTIDFGTVLVGSTKDTTFTIANTGGLSLSCDVSADCEHFAITHGSGPNEVDVGSELEVTVRFAPSAAGTWECTVETGNEICSDVACTGIGDVFEVVSIPSAPSGEASICADETQMYSTGGATSSEGHSLEYRFDWGDGTLSNWSADSTASYSWSLAAIYQVRARARCATHTDKESGWSDALSVTVTEETVSTPDAPSGSSSACPDDSSSYTTGRASCSCGHDVEYQFDWGDGSFSTWSSAEAASYAWSSLQTCEVKARARCAVHNDVVSSWSEAKTVTVEEVVSTPSSPSGPATVCPDEAEDYATGGTTSSCGHTLEYRFDWGDGEFSDWSSSASASHSWPSFDTYEVKVQARCATHTSVTSEWSSGKTVTVEETISKPSTPSGPTAVCPEDGNSYSTSATSSCSHSLQYQFDWGDGQTSTWSSSSSRSHSWSSAGTYNVKSLARCESHTDKVSLESSARAVTVADESISKPSTPSGATTACPGVSKTYSTGATSSCNHSLQYRFDWGDGSAYSAWSSSSSASHAWSSFGTYQVKALARCATHTDKESEWSIAKTVTIEETISTPNTPSGDASVCYDRESTYTTGGATSSCGNSIQYRFDWGDGSFSSWSSSVTASHSWPSPGSHSVTAWAKSATHTSEESAGLTVSVVDANSDIAVWPVYLYFGYVPVGDSKDMSFEIESLYPPQFPAFLILLSLEGSSNFAIIDVHESGKVPDGMLSPGEIATVTVRFTHPPIIPYGKTCRIRANGCHYVNCVAE